MPDRDPERGPLLAGMLRLVPLGDRALLACFADEVAASRWASAVGEQGWPGILDVVPAYLSVGVFADPDLLPPDELERRLLRIPIPEPREFDGELVHVPVLYDGADLGEVSRRLGLAKADVVSLHAAHDYRVFAIGFLPGFPYAGYLPAPLSGLARRDSPRQRVAAGSVAIVGRQTGVYPADSPGGWHLLGRTPLRIADPVRGEFPIRAGDRLRFEPIERREFEARRGEPLCRAEPST